MLNKASYFLYLLTTERITTLVNAIANIGTDAAAAIPESMNIQFESPGNTTGGAELFQNLVEWVDRQISKAVLGQTASTEGTAGKLGGDDLQADVRTDILKSDAQQLDNTLNRDLVTALIDLNFGVQQNYPRIVHQISEPEDLHGLVTALQTLVPLGLQIEESWARDKLGAPQPTQGAKLLTAPSYDAGFGNMAGFNLGLNTQLNPALNAQQPQAKPTPADIITNQLAQEADDEMAKWLGKIEVMLEQAQSLEELRAMLLAAFSDLPTNKLGALIGEASAAVQAAGFYDVEHNHA